MAAKFELSQKNLGPYLESLLGQPVKIIGMAPLGEAEKTGVLKGYGYGIPVEIEYEAEGRRQRAVLETIIPGPFGHDHVSDRAQAHIWNHHAFNLLPRHVRSLDAGGFLAGGRLCSVGGIEEFFSLTEFVEGEGYFTDLGRLRDTNRLTDLDLSRADALCDYLVKIHKAPGSQPGLYTRRIRDLIGHGECIMGLMDSYPPRHGFITADLLEQIETRCIAWRWRLKGRTHRLRQVHGDFHPWNILFRSGADFSVLDRSRGEWGDPADDVTCLTLNYLFFDLQRDGGRDGGLRQLFHRFWDRYLEKTGDREILEVAAPFIVFRCIVMASPVWYPHLSESVRRRLFNLIGAVLDTPAFDPSRVDDYLES